MTSGGFVVPEGYEFGVAEDGAGGPFGEFDFGDCFGAEPYIVRHLFGGDAFPPMALFGGGQVCEWATVGAQGSQRFEEHCAVGGIEALVNFAGEQEFSFFEVADQDELETFAV